MIRTYSKIHSHEKQNTVKLVVGDLVESNESDKDFLHCSSLFFKALLQRTPPTLFTSFKFSQAFIHRPRISEKLQENTVDRTYFQTKSFTEFLFEVFFNFQNVGFKLYVCARFYLYLPICKFFVTN